MSENKNSEAHHIAVRRVTPSREPAFRPPEQVEAADERAIPTNNKAVVGNNMPLDDMPVAAHSFSGGSTPKKKSWLKRLTKKHWLIVGAAAAVLGLAVLACFVIWPQKAAAPAHHATITKQLPPTPQPTTVASTLTGLAVDPSVNQRPVTAVMIENSTFARPQSGLDQAGVVFEAVAEGGITRFLTLFQDTQPDYIGPIRSVRPYYLQWLLGFDAAVAHVGGSPEAINDIKAWGVKNLDQEYNGSFYTRVSSRAAPHNVYTSITNLNTLETKLGFGASHFTGFARKPDAASKTPTTTSIDFNISSADYAVHYDYDPATNTYKRSEGGKPHMSVSKAGVQTQIAPKVVVALVMPQSLEADGLHSQYGTIGSGAMFVFQDGVLTQGTWSKASSGQQFVFTDQSGQPLKLNAGQTWITVLGAANRVSYH